ncbi:MAG: ABC transporter ATP-binding protein [Candidatus Aminicenantes bacterium]|jgi:ABC-2 type transport system ATP-binding protein
MSTVKTKDLTKAFDQITAIDGISLEIEKGEIIGLIGPDGAGKTTLIRLLLGLLEPSAGRVWIDGLDIAQNKRQVKHFIGYMPQHFSLYGDLSVSQNMKFFADLYTVPQRQYEERKKDLLRFSGLLPFQHRLARNLSGGMQKKLALSCNLFHTPKILFLDEPTTGVDPVSRKELWDFLFALNGQGVTLFVSTPYMDEAQKCHRVALIFEGHILAFTHPEDLIKGFTGEVIEFVSDSKDARNQLKTMPSLRNIYPYAETLHLTFDASADGAEITEAFCLKKNIKARSIKKIPPSLEDAFLELIRQQ